MRCTPKHLFSPQLGHCSRCPAWSPSCPASRRSRTLRKEAGKVLQSLALSAASKNKSKYPSNNLLEVEGGFAPATNFIASQTVEGFWSWPVHSGEKKSVCAPCYLTLLKGNFSVLGNTLILSSPICDLWISAPALLFSLNICGGVTVQWCPLFFFLIRRNKKCFSRHPELTMFPFTLHLLLAEGSTQCIFMASLHSHLVAHKGQVERARPDLVHGLQLT